MGAIRRSLIMLPALASFAFMPVPAGAGDGAFINSFKGDWRGSGIVKVRTSSPPIMVDCNFRSDTTARSLTLDGICRAFVVVRKRISARVAFAEGRYRGTYEGARTGPASLDGARSGNAIVLKIGWAGEVNGDLMADMQVKRTGADSMVLEISDTDPKSGKKLTTSRIRLQRTR